MPITAPATLDPKALAPTHDEDFLAKNPTADEHLTRLERADRHHDMQRQIRHQTNEERRADIVTERERAAREKDPTKKKRHETNIARMRADQEHAATQKAAPTFGPSVRKWASVNRNGNFVPVAMPKLDGESYKDAKRDLNSELTALAGIENANRSTEEAQADFKNNFWRAKQREGAVEFHELLMGGRHDMNGKFVPATSSRVAWPEQSVAATFNLTNDAGTVRGGISVNIPPGFATLAWLDGEDGPLLKKFFTRIAEANEGRPVISMAEKAEMLKAQAAKVLAARRRLEAIIVAHESKDPPEYLPRPAGTPPEVLLWLERAPANVSAPAPKPKPNGKAGTLMDLKNADDNFEGDDA